MQRKFLANSENFSLVDYGGTTSYAVFYADAMRFFNVPKDQWDDFVTAVQDGESGGYLRTEIPGRNIFAICHRSKPEKLLVVKKGLWDEFRLMIAEGNRSIRGGNVRIDGSA